jgi:hypothetical protein
MNDGSVHGDHLVTAGGSLGCRCWWLIDGAPDNHGLFIWLLLIWQRMTRKVKDLSPSEWQLKRILN